MSANKQAIEIRPVGMTMARALEIAIAAGERRAHSPKTSEQTVGAPTRYYKPNGSWQLNSGRSSGQSLTPEQHAAIAKLDHLSAREASERLGLSTRSIYRARAKRKDTDDHRQNTPG